MGTLPRRPISEVKPVAEELVGHLVGVCERIQVAGSIRRNRPEVGDIELVAIPKFEGRRVTVQRSLFDTPQSKTDPINLLWGRLDQLRVSYTKEGPIYRQFTFKGVRVDAYCCERGNWGWILFHRTGPGYLRQKIGWMLVQQGYAAADGWIWDARPGKISIDRVETPEEEDVFRLLGIPYLPPDQRDKLKAAPVEAAP